MEISANNTLIGNSSTDDLNRDVPFLAICLKMTMCLVMIPSIVIPSLLVIHVIWKNEQLHTKYYFFVVNLLVVDVATTGRYGLEVVSIVLYLFGLPSEYGYVIYTIFTIPRVVLRYAFVLLAIDRFICISFPYRHKNIMTTKVSYTLISAVWLVAAGVTVVIRVTSAYTFEPAFGKYLANPNPNSRPFIFVAIVLPMLATAVVTIFTNAYLYYCTFLSNKKLHENMRLDGGNQHEINTTKRLLHYLRMQLKPTISVLILGGIDVIMIASQSVILALALSFTSGTTRSYLSLFSYLLDWCQLLSHSFVNGFYMKDIRRQLKRYAFYQRIQRLFPLRPSQVVVLNAQHG